MLDLDPDYCIKCSYAAPSKKMKRSRTSEMLDEKEEVKEAKFSKIEVKFQVQIFCVQHKGFDHVIDLQLTQGHPLVFFSLSNKLYGTIEHLCNTH